MRDRVNRRQILASASAAVAFTVLPKLPAVASIVGVPLSPLPNPNRMLGELAIPIEELTARFEKVMNTPTYANTNRALRQALWGALEARAQPVRRSF